MKRFTIERSLRGACAAVILLGVAAFADSSTPGNPETNASDKNYGTDQPNSIPGGIQKTEDAGNRALNKVDNGVHKGVHKTRHGAKKAKHKADKAVDQLTEPAKEPAQ